ncbi:MAG TPA: RDD family protein [Pengzhenrongella sp.]
MTARRYPGSWLEGAGSGGGEPGVGGGEPGVGGRLALPAGGPGSLARVNRRLVALAIDWLACVGISTAFLGGDPMATLAIFAVENVLLVASIGHTLGHRLLGVRVRRVPAGADGRAVAGPVGLARAALRTALLCLVIPAVVWDGDGRGMHDRAAGTVIVRS